MQGERAARVVTILALAVVARAAPLAAQPVEIGAIGGYRFGGDLFEAAAAHRLDVDGAPAIGVVLDVPMGDGLQFEGLFTHQVATVPVPLDGFGPTARWHVAVDQWQVGGLQELSAGHARPFLTGLVGLTRYAAEADSEIRFSVGGGGGVKLFPLSRLGVRLDGRLFATFVDADTAGLACVQGKCLLAFRVDIAWQAEFMAALIVRLP